jgi:hypothetical protein
VKLCLRVTSCDQPLNERTMRQLTGALDDAEDQAVCRELFLNARVCGMKSVGEVVRAVEAMMPVARTTVADRIRKRLGLPTSGVKAMQEASRQAAAMVAATSGWQVCPACGRQPIKRGRRACRRRRTVGGLPSTSTRLRQATSRRATPACGSARREPLSRFARTRRSIQREAEARERLHQQKLELRKYEAEQMRLAEEARRAAFNAEVPDDYFRV